MTRLETENNHSLKRIAAALERIADSLAIGNALCVQQNLPGYWGGAKLAEIHKAVKEDIDSLIQNRGGKE